MEPSDEKLYVVLESAMLETAKMKKTGEFKLLNSDDHGRLLSKMGKDVSMYRPDITHHCLLNLFDSPLCKAGKLRVYVHTHENVLIEISPHCRIPRTFKRFAGLMAHLLHTRKIKGEDTNQVLMRVVKNPISRHLPVGSYKVGTSVVETITNINEFVENLCKPREENETPQTPVFVIGACPFGHPCKDLDYTDTCISISNYGLSGGICCSKITSAFERVWNVM